MVRSMIEPGHIKTYLKLKQEITKLVTDPASGFQESRRHLSEGLARTMAINAEEWTYSTQSGGYAFTNHRHRFSIFVAEEPQPESYFTTQELVNYLRAFTALEDLNNMVVDTWLTHAAMRGEVTSVNKGWTLVNKSTSE